MAERGKSVKLGEIIREFQLEILNKGPNYEDMPLTTLDVNRPGLPLSGFFEHFDARRLLVIGLTEHTYLSGMEPQARRESFDRLLAHPVPALIITRELEPFPECMEMAIKHERTVLRTQEHTSAFMSRLIGSLFNHLAPQITRSGVMMEIYGEGVLIQGESGVGKSEVAMSSFSGDTASLPTTRWRSRRPTTVPLWPRPLSSSATIWSFAALAWWTCGGCLV